MEHAEYPVDIVNETGSVVGQKARRDINKSRDLYHSVFSLLITPAGEVIVSTIPTRKDLPNLYAGRFGAPAATIRRHDESAEEAAARSLSRELGIAQPKLHYLGDQFSVYPDGHRTYLSVYYVVTLPPQNYSKIDFTKLSMLQPIELDRQLRETPQRFAPTFQTLWQNYHKKLDKVRRTLLVKSLIA